ncbi:Uncharacterized protein Rs2_32914 [Raphanus sativus]|nr:Uncharacterized protein Rs2_32914 [Raphanus sativus]
MVYFFALTTLTDYGVDLRTQWPLKCRASNTVAAGILLYMVLVDFTAHLPIIVNVKVFLYPSAERLLGPVQLTRLAGVLMILVQLSSPFIAYLPGVPRSILLSAASILVNVFSEASSRVVMGRDGSVKKHPSKRGGIRDHRSSIISFPLAPVYRALTLAYSGYLSTVRLAFDSDGVPSSSGAVGFCLGDQSSEYGALLKQ